MSETVEPWDDAKIREAFIYDGGEAAHYDPINGEKEQRRIAGDIFDAWLERHDAEKRTEWEARLREAEAAIEAIDAIEPMWPRGMYGCPQDMIGRNQIRAVTARYKTTKTEKE